MYFTEYDQLRTLQTKIIKKTNTFAHTGLIRVARFPSPTAFLKIKNKKFGSKDPRACDLLCFTKTTCSKTHLRVGVT